MLGTGPRPTMTHHRLPLLLGFIALGSILPAGCTTSVTRDPGQPVVAQAVSPTSQVAKITVELTPEVKARIASSLKFNPSELRDRVQLALTSRDLYAFREKPGTYTLHILVDHVRVRSTFNAVMWGFMSGNDALDGEVTVLDAAGTVRDRFRVSTAYALGGWGGGQDQTRVGWLYEAFAKHLVAQITGEAAKR
jgi:hypothetical protein